MVLSTCLFFFFWLAALIWSLELSLELCSRLPKAPDARTASYNRCPCIRDRYLPILICWNSSAQVLCLLNSSTRTEIPSFTVLLIFFWTLHVFGMSFSKATKKFSPPPFGFGWSPPNFSRGPWSQAHWREWTHYRCCLPDCYAVIAQRSANLNLPSLLCHVQFSAHLNWRGYPCVLMASCGMGRSEVARNRYTLGDVAPTWPPFARHR